ncbi:unnamed protein product, partial [Durusdinium trenchii]
DETVSRVLRAASEKYPGRSAALEQPRGVPRGGEVAGEVKSGAQGSCGKDCQDLLQADLVVDDAIAELQ